MVRLTAEQYVEKHARRLKGSLQDVRDGVARVTVSPGSQAAQKKDKMLSRLTESVNSGKWARNVQAVSLQEWQTLMSGKGVDRISAGIDGAAAKVQKMATQLLAYESTLQEQVNRMPDMTLEDSVARASTWIRNMSKFEVK